MSFRVTIVDTYAWHVVTTRLEAMLHLELEVLMKGVSKAWLRRLYEQAANRVYNRVPKDVRGKTGRRKKMVQKREK